MTELTAPSIGLRDHLTGLPNRAYLYDWLEQNIGRISPRGQFRNLVVVLLDLDRFKLLNDRHGHDAGDQLLMAVANRLSSLLKEGEFAVRLGGDEFVLVLPNQPDAAEIRERLYLMAQSFIRTFLLLDEDLQFAQHMSIGVYILTKPHTSVAQIIKCADLAMYEAKQNGHDLDSKIVAFTPKLLENEQHRVRLRNDIRRLASSGQLGICYQPIIGIAEKQPVGFESLILQPADLSRRFDTEEIVEILDELGKLTDLVRQHIAAACQLLSDLNQINGYKRYISVNLTPSQLESGELMGFVRTQVKLHQIEPWQLAFEITEGQAVSHPAHFRRYFNSLRSFGCGLILDDFGRGHADFERLRQHHWTTIKYDKTLTGFEDERSNELLHGLNKGCRGLNMHVIAEWIETMEQASIASWIGCDRLQGALFGPTHLRAPDVLKYLDSFVYPKH